MRDSGRLSNRPTLLPTIIRPTRKFSASTIPLSWLLLWSSAYHQPRVLITRLASGDAFDCCQGWRGLAIWNDLPLLWPSPVTDFAECWGLYGTMCKEFNIWLRLLYFCTRTYMQHLVSVGLSDGLVAGSNLAPGDRSAFILGRIVGLLRPSKLGSLINFLLPVLEIWAKNCFDPLYFAAAVSVLASTDFFHSR